MLHFELNQCECFQVNEESPQSCERKLKLDSNSKNKILSNVDKYYPVCTKTPHNASIFKYRKIMSNPHFFLIIK